jgi:hypothetical protein
MIWSDRVRNPHVSMAIRQFKRSFDKDSLNDLGRACGLCRREREVTPFRLALALLSCFAAGQARYIADIVRAFNALTGAQVRYKPFHNQLAKRQFPTFMRLLVARLLEQLACEALRFDVDSPFARFERVHIQDGTSFAVKSPLRSVFPGRFTKVSPAAVELHVDMDLFSETANTITLTPDSASERHCLPEPEELIGALLLADRGYFCRHRLRAMGDSGAHFIVRAGATINPLIVSARRVDGGEVKSLRAVRLRQAKAQLARHGQLDMEVEFPMTGGPWRCRVVARAKASDGKPCYLVTNLSRDEFSATHVSDGYRLRWQIELLFKEWKSYANLRAFDTANAHIAEGLIWAALFAATVKRFCAHAAERAHGVAVSTHTAAKCIHHVLHDVLRAMMGKPSRMPAAFRRLLAYLRDNAARAKPKRDQRTGRNKLGLRHVYATA